MKINEKIHYFKTNYAKDLKSEVPLYEKASDEIPAHQDEYIHSEKSEKKPKGLYWLGQAETGNRKIFFDNPECI